LFEKYLQNEIIDGYISNIVVYEIEQTPDLNKRALLKHAYQSYNIRLLRSNIDDVLELAMEYISRKIIPERYVDDARHIATATIENMDAVVSWNFRHMANIKIERLITQANHELGYTNPLRITTPMEVIV